MYSYSRRRDVTTPLQILSSHILIKHIRMFAFTLLWYLRVNFLQYINPSIIVCFPNSSVGLHPEAHFCVYVICIYTNNADYIKYRTKKYEQFLNPYIIVCFPEYFLSIFVIGGDTPFCAFGYEIIDFYLTRKKTGRRYGQSSKFVSRYCLYTCFYP